MRFRDYIIKHGIDACATKWGMTPRAVKGYRYGERMPRPDDAIKIAAASNGELTLSDIYESASGSSEAA